MNSLELISSRGINEKFKGVKEMGEMGLEITWGAEVQKIKKQWETD